MLALSSCSDYLDVDPATNAATPQAVYKTEAETSKALNGIYAKIINNNTFGNSLYNTFQLNSDVDFTANANETAQGTKPQRFDVRSDASDVEKLWNALYSGIETANEFIYNLENSSIYVEETKDETITDADGGNSFTKIAVPNNITQMMGEAKVMRAMFYHELLSYFGDVPFTLEPTSATNNFTPAVAKRQTISDALIADLKHAADYMYSDQKINEAPRRISQEAAYAMIARLALQAGGYSLNHDEGDATGYKMTRPDNYKDYYQTAYDYAKKVVDAGTHALNLTYQDVFVNECNYMAVHGDDVIFELPFVKGSTSNWGYNQGPTSSVDVSDANWTNSEWGKTSGGVRTTYFYRYSFAQNDLRRNYTCGLWYYSSKGLPTIRLDYAMHNNKWSKLWSKAPQGVSTEGATGISFAYIRYADVLLMLAEADNELNDGPTDVGKNALKTVRKRAFDQADWADMVDFYVDTEVSGSKEDFLKAVLNERKWEFAGENMRWKDLVRNNMYSEALLYTFLTYYAVAETQTGPSEYIEQVKLYTGRDDMEDLTSEEFKYAYLKNCSEDLMTSFPNSKLYMMYVVNGYGDGETTTASNPDGYLTGLGYDITDSKFIETGKGDAKNKISWGKASISWANDDTSFKGQINNSLFGYIRADEFKNILIVNNGAVTSLSLDNAATEDAIKENIKKLPAVRYLLPYPEEAIARSAGAYKNYYGY